MTDEPMMEGDKPEYRNKCKPAIYAIHYPILKEIANEHGFALTLHGSLQGDLDIIAIPWTETAKTSEELVNAFAEYVAFSQDDKTVISTANKPFGRKVYTIQMGLGYIDLGIVDIREVAHHEATHADLRLDAPLANAIIDDVFNEKGEAEQ